MQRYWLKIALGAAAVFGLGMGVIALVSNSIHEVKSVLASNRPIGIPLMILPFRLDGDQIGSIRRLELLRTSPSEVSGIRLTVRLRDSVTSARLPDCRLTIYERQALGGQHGFQCRGSSDSAAEHLKQIGEVVFEPGGAVRAIFAPADHVALWGVYDTAAVRAELARLQADGLADAAARVRIKADSAGAVIEVGRHAEQLVRIQADSHGASMRIRDRSGRNLVRLHADSTGASFSILEDFAGRSR